MLKMKATSEEPRYRPYSITHEMRKLTPPIRINGEKVIRYRAPVVTEYVDMKTGEIIQAAALPKDLEVWPIVHFSERVLQREFILTSLRKEVREFAVFVLAFRNQRRGVTPGVDELAKWYANLTGQQACHVRRYVPRLEAAGVLAGSSLLCPLFQIAGNNTTTSTHLGEDFRAYANFVLMLIEKRASTSLQAILEAVQPGITRQAIAAFPRIISSSRSTVLEYIQCLISAGKLPVQFPKLSAY
jgi:hypothetical protein